MFPFPTFLGNKKNLNTEKTKNCFRYFFEMSGDQLPSIPERDRRFFYFQLLHSSPIFAATIGLYQNQVWLPLTMPTLTRADPARFGVGATEFQCGTPQTWHEPYVNTLLDCEVELGGSGFGDYFGRVRGYAFELPGEWYDSLVGVRVPGGRPIVVSWYPPIGTADGPRDILPHAGIYVFQRRGVMSSLGGVQIAHSPRHLGAFVVTRCTRGVPQELDTDPLRLAFMKWASTFLPNLPLPPWSCATREVMGISPRAFPYLGSNYRPMENSPGWMAHEVKEEEVEIKQENN